MIPKVIHQIWLGPLQLPVQWIKSWENHHPDWEHKLWSEEDINFPLQCIRQYLLARTYAGKADILRCEILWRYGGIYSDADSVCLRPIDEKLLSRDFLAAYENEKVHPGRVANGFIGCQAQHPVIKYMIDEIRSLTAKEMQGYDFVVTGPVLLTRILGSHAYSAIMPSYLFYPYYYSGEKCSVAQFKKAYALQMWGSTGGTKEFNTLREQHGYHESMYNGKREQKPLSAIYHTVVKQNPEYQLQKHAGSIVLTADNDECDMALSGHAVIILELCKDWIKIQDLIDFLTLEFPGYSEEIGTDVYDLACDFIRTGVFLVNPELG